MKIAAILIFFLFSYQSHAACRCNCDPSDRSLCASTYDLDHPCFGICPSQATSMIPIGKTACPTALIYNLNKGKYEWIALCFH